MAHVATVQYTARDNHLLEAVALAHQTNWGEWLGEVANRAIVESCSCHGLFVGPAAKTYVLITLSTEPPAALPAQLETNRRNAYSTTHPDPRVCSPPSDGPARCILGPARLCCYCWAAFRAL